MPDAATTGNGAGSLRRLRSSAAAKVAPETVPVGKDFPPTPATPAERLDEAVTRLLRAAPELSAASPMAVWQRRLFGGGCAFLAIALVAAPQETVAVLFALLAVPFLCVFVLRALALQHVLGTRAPTPDEPVEPIGPAPDCGWPAYAILVPLYQEAEVVPGLVAALSALDYPAERLDIVLILEENDAATREAIAAVSLPRHMRTLVVPRGVPKTKPRALDYALLDARGDLVVVYDAEDIPEPDQLRRAVEVFAAGPADLGCLQARLNVYNPNDSFLTRQFAIEYTALFDAILPTLEHYGMPVPLGGTSNHFRREALEASGAWDPYNVTEDADLGIRMARLGWRVGTLASTTWEEAPARFAVWHGQRTRWLKGWMQTWLVHTRQPARLLRELGAVRFLGLQVLMGGLLLSALVNPLFYAALAAAALTGTFVPGSVIVHATDPLLWLGAVTLLSGYASAVVLGAVCVARRGWTRLALRATLMPAYWLLISLAAYRALGELVARPFHWEKTKHNARLVIHEKQN